MNKIAFITLKTDTEVEFYVNPYHITTLEKLGSNYTIDLLDGSARVISNESGEKLKRLFLDDRK